MRDSSTRTEAGVTVIVLPRPTVNGPLHIGHVSGPYLGADVAARAARARGERVLTLAGLDTHPNYVLTKAETLGEDVDEMITRYRAQILAAYQGARIEYDAFLDPQQPVLRRTVAGLLRELVENGTVPMREMTLHRCADCGRTLHHSYVVGNCPGCGTGANGTSCEGCGGLTSAQNLVDPSCARCGGQPEPLVVTVPVLPLEDYRPRLVAEWLQAELPSQVRAIIQHYQRAPLPDYPLAYPTNWGIECDGPLAGLRVDFPTELGLGYLYGPATAVRPGATGLTALSAAFAEEVAGLWQFEGMDNTFYFAVLYPAILAAAGVPAPTLLGATVNELYLLEGQKFSTSRNHALWADEFLAKEDPELVRLYLSWDRPDRYESNFTHAAYQEFGEQVRSLLTPDGTGGGTGPGGTGSSVLAGDELTRAEHALRLTGFDSALAVRCLLAALAGGAGHDSMALAALAGRPLPGPGTG